MARLLGSAMMVNDDSTTDVIAERLYRSDSREPSKTTKAAESLGSFGALLPWLHGFEPATFGVMRENPAHKPTETNQLNPTKTGAYESAALFRVGALRSVYFIVSS